MTKTIYERAIEHFGIDHQSDRLIEELSELIQSVLKHRRYNNSETLDNLYEEFADVRILMSQLETTLVPVLLQAKKEQKLKRLETLLKMTDENEPR